MLLQLLRTRLRPYSRLLAIVAVLQLLQVIASLWLPSLNADIIDHGVRTGDRGYIVNRGLVMLIVSALQVLFSIGAVYFGSRAAMAFGRDVRHDLFHRVTAYSAREVNYFGAPSLITRITNDVQQTQILIVLSATMAVAAPMTMVGGVIMAVREDVGLSALLLVSVPVLAIVAGVVVSRMVPQFRRMQQRIDNVNRILREQIMGVRVVRAFVREPVETIRFAGANRELTDTSLHAGRLQAIMFPSVGLILNVSMAAAVWIGADRIGAQKMQVGAMVAFLTYLAQILMSLMMATFVIMMIPRASVSADRIMEVLDTETSVKISDAAVREVTGHGVLELRDVEFRYPGAEAPVVRGVSFVAQPGTTTAIVGSTGAGKTTLVQLVPRLADATGGTVLLDGVDVRELAPEVLWERIGLVPQRPYLFSGTVRSNLQFGKPDASDDEIWAALDVAQAADFVRAMPDGLDTVINQGGTNVSGGQRQRLAIARALVHRPEIYLFDDSFSALDVTTDANLRAALRPWTEDAAVIIVAQRVSTILGADQILVLDEGHPVGLGTHEALLRTCATYAEIVESQLGSAAA